MLNLKGPSSLRRLVPSQPRWAAVGPRITARWVAGPHSETTDQGSMWPWTQHRTPTTAFVARRYNLRKLKTPVIWSRARVGHHWRTWSGTLILATSWRWTLHVQSASSSLTRTWKKWITWSGTSRSVRWTFRRSWVSLQMGCCIRTCDMAGITAPDTAPTWRSASLAEATPHQSS